MSLLHDYQRVRRTTLEAASTLTPEDCVLQAMPDVSPPKWHLGHTTWLFETFVLERVAGYPVFDPAFAYLFNSYYEAAGPRQPRDRRGVLSRPALDRVLAYRAHVDHWIERAYGQLDADGLTRLVLGLHHEQQHQELLVMDVKYNFGESPLSPAYRPPPSSSRARLPSGPARFVSVRGGVCPIGHGDDGSFAYDNEGPVHERVVEPFRIADRLVTNGEMREFIRDGGYSSPALWLSDGIAWVRREDVRAPLYWRFEGDEPAFEMTAHGLLPWDRDAPVCHVSAYEAAAFAAWAGARLPTEFEWEVAASGSDPARARWLEDGLDAGGSLHPGLGDDRSPEGALDLFGDVWVWTRSAYEPYPRYRPLAGALGEYNGKFMSNQWVLRGGCIATPRGHIRRTYRNFFYPHQRWPFTGIRLAKDGS